MIANRGMRHLALTVADVGRARELVVAPVGRIVKDDAESCADGIQEMLSRSREEVRLAAERVQPRIDFRGTMNSLVDVLRAAEQSHI